MLDGGVMKWQEQLREERERERGIFADIKSYK